MTDVRKRIFVINVNHQQRVPKCWHPAITIAILNFGLECPCEIPESGSGTSHVWTETLSGQESMTPTQAAHAECVAFFSEIGALVEVEEE